MSEVGLSARLRALRERWLAALEREAAGDYLKPSYEIDGQAIDWSGRRVDLLWCVATASALLGEGPMPPDTPAKFGAGVAWREEVLERLNAVAAALSSQTQIVGIGDDAVTHNYEVTTNG